MPLDAEANLPERCYSYLLQEWMDLFSIRESFGEAEVSLKKLLGLKVSQSRIEVVNQESNGHYDAFYQKKELPPANSEGDIQALGFDGKGVPMIKEEAAKLQGRLGKGEKKQKKKEAMVGVSYTVNRKVRTAEEVADNLVYPEREKEKRDNGGSDSICAQNVCRLASLERSKEEVVQEIVGDAKLLRPTLFEPICLKLSESVLST